jgi:hypothetical protein
VDVLAAADVGRGGADERPVLEQLLAGADRAACELVADADRARDADRFAFDRHRVAFAQGPRDDETVVVRRKEHEAAVRIFHT